MARRHQCITPARSWNSAYWLHGGLRSPRGPRKAPRRCSQLTRRRSFSTTADQLRRWFTRSLAAQRRARRRYSDSSPAPWCLARPRAHRHLLGGLHAIEPAAARSASSFPQVLVPMRDRWSLATSLSGAGCQLARWHDRCARPSGAACPCRREAVVDTIDVVLPRDRAAVRCASFHSTRSSSPSTADLEGEGESIGKAVADPG